MKFKRKEIHVTQDPEVWLEMHKPYEANREYHRVGYESYEDERGEIIVSNHDYGDEKANCHADKTMSRAEAIKGCFFHDDVVYGRLISETIHYED